MAVKKWTASVLALLIMCTAAFPAWAAGGPEEAQAAAANAEQAKQGEGQDKDKAKTMDGLDETISLIALPQAQLQLPCKAALLMCAETGDVLYNDNGDTQLPIASITKVMTLLLTMEAVENGKASLSDIVPVSEHAYGMGGSQIWLEPGEQITLDEMLKAICVSSANDAAVAVAEYIGGSEPGFVDMMNRRAQELGMENTHFMNACGLDTADHYSTAHDVAIMSRALLRHPLILEYSGIWQDSLRGGATQLTNTNKLLKRYQGITGLKTGTTGGAGVCISATATRDNMTLIGVVLGSSSSEDRFAAATSLLDYGFANCEVIDLPDTGPLEPVAVTGGAAETVAPVCSIPLRALVEKGSGKDLVFETTLPETVGAPVAAGQQLGEIVLKRGEEKVAVFPITAQEEVKKMDFGLSMSLLLRALFQL